MALEDLSASTTTTSSSLPSWYTDAQKQAVSSATGAAGNVPNIANTAAQSAINMFSPGATNPFTQGQQYLGQIAQGATNAFNTTYDAAGNAITTPNVSTPMGGLYAAQQQYLNQLMPNIDTTATGSSLAGGGFGSRMNLSALSGARAQAANELFKNQMQSALANQQTGVAAAAGLGNLGQQQLEGALKTGAFQVEQPFAEAKNLAAILSQLGPEKTQTMIETPGLYEQLIALGSLGKGGLESIETLFPDVYKNVTDFFKNI